MAGYIDLYLLCVPKKNLAEYKKQATVFGKLIVDFGAIRYREFTQDDLKSKGTRNYIQTVKPKKGEVIITAVVDFKSRQHRDRLMKKMHKDPRMVEMMKIEQVFEVKRMVYGGFQSLVDIE